MQQQHKFLLWKLSACLFMKFHFSVCVICLKEQWNVWRKMYIRFLLTFFSFFGEGGVDKHFMICHQMSFFFFFFVKENAHFVFVCTNSISKYKWLFILRFYVCYWWYFWRKQTRERNKAPHMQHFIVQLCDSVICRYFQREQFSLAVICIVYWWGLIWLSAALLSWTNTSAVALESVNLWAVTTHSSKINRQNANDV